MAPRVISLSPAFLKLLRVEASVAYALRPTFATRLEVFSNSNYNYNSSYTKYETGGWLACALIITQGGQLYLFDTEGGHIINAALLTPPNTGATIDNINNNINNNEGKAIVEIITQPTPDTVSGTQCVYMRCRQPLMLTQVYNFIQSKNSNNNTKRENINNNNNEENMDTVNNHNSNNSSSTSEMYPPFSYLMRFHCRNAPVALQMISIMTNFLNPRNGEISLRQTKESLEQELDQSSFSDPAAFIPAKLDGSNKWTSKVSKISPLKRFLPSKSNRNFILIKDIAIYEKKKLTNAGEIIEIPPPFNPHTPVRPISMPIFAKENEKIISSSNNNNNNNNNNSDNQLQNLDKNDSIEKNLFPQPIESKINIEKKEIEIEFSKQLEDKPKISNSELNKFYEEIFQQVPHFTLSSSQDLLYFYGLPGFETQYAIFLVQQNIIEFIERNIEKLLINFPSISNILHDRLVAREVVCEELRMHFGVTYRELCDITRKRIENISLDKILIEEEFVIMRKSHEIKLQSLEEEYKIKRQKMLEEEENIYFNSSHEIKSVKTGKKLESICLEENTEWHKELTQAVNALELIEIDIQRLEYAMNDDKQELNSNISSLNIKKRDNRTQFNSLKDEATFILHEIQMKQDILKKLKLHSNKYNNNNNNDDNVIIGEMKNNTTLEGICSEYNTLVLQQQEQIDQIKQELLRIVSSFGINARWIEEQSRRRSVADEVLDNSYRL